MKIQYKFVLCVNVIMILIFSLCVETFAIQGSYLQKYFKKAISLFENKKYEEAIKVFKYIIKIEDNQKQFYFTPFAEVYIDKSRARNVTLIPKKRRAAKSKTKKVLTSEHVERQVEVGGEAGGHVSVDRVYEELMDYYDEKQEHPGIMTTYSAEDREWKIDTYLDEAQYKHKGTKPERRSFARKENAYDESGWTRLGPKPLVEIEDNRKIVNLYKDGEFGDLLYEAIDSGLENLDDDMLMFFDDQRFKDIVERIATYKLWERTW